MRPRWVRRTVLLASAVLWFGCAAVGSHLWTGQPWGSALLLAALMAAGWTLSMEAWERRRFDR
jgi:hypothetical protein